MSLAYLRDFRRIFYFPFFSGLLGIIIHHFKYLLNLLRFYFFEEKVDTPKQREKEYKILLMVPGNVPNVF